MFPIKKKWLLDVKIEKWNDYKRQLEAIIVLYHGSFKILIVILDVKIGADSFRIKKERKENVCPPIRANIKFKETLTNSKFSQEVSKVWQKKYLYQRSNMTNT